MTTNRRARVERKTKESDIVVELDLDGTGVVDISTGVPFYDHMLTALGSHASFDLTVQAKGDVEIEGHHTIEDTAIVLGQALREALGDKKGIRRFGDAFIPMDETLAHAAVDVSGRPFCLFVSDLPPVSIAGFEAELTEEFFRAVATNAKLTLHLSNPYGSNAHHMIEACFKAFARALRDAVSIDPDEPGVPSTKGTLTG